MFVKTAFNHPKIDYAELVSRADLHYEHTVKRSEGGLPLGNGKMGSLLWTSPSALKFQVNRVDVYANDCNTNSFNQRHSDYAYASGFVDIDFVDYGEDVFHDHGIKQHLHLFDGLAKIAGEGVQAEVFASAHQDVFGVRVQDERVDPQGINIKLKMMRPAEVVTKNHSAISALSMRDGMIVLKQEFREGGYYCSSAVAIGINGRAAKARMNDELGGRMPVGSFRESQVIGQPNETEMRLCVKPGLGIFDIFIGSAASFDEHEDVVETAIRTVQQAITAGYDRLFQEHKTWWNRFWEKSYIRLSSEDNSAETVEQHYTYYLYLMASNSRGGQFPPNFGGMLLSPRGDLRHWGAMHWWNNMNLYYNAVLPSGHNELFQPYFNMYSSMLDSCATAAKQQWDSDGIYIPEVVTFNGMEELPEAIAAEMRDLYLVRKPWDQMTDRFREFAYSKRPHESRWNWKYHEKYVDGKLVYVERDYGAFGFTTHMFASQVGIAYHFWMYFEYTKDEAWLRERAYPMIKGVAEFFRHFPNLRKGADGSYHIYNTTSDEKYYGGQNTMDSMAGMHTIFPVALKASEILSVDEDLSAAWKEIYEHLAPLPRSDHPDAVLRTQENEPAVWVGSLGPVLDNKSGISLKPGAFGNLSSLETQYENPEMYETTLATMKYQEALLDHDWSRGASEMSSTARVLAHMGLAEPFKEFVLAQLACVNAEREYCYFADTGRVKFYDNRLTVREGVNCISIQRLGNAASALQAALCQSQPPGPGKESVIRLFPACPADWNAEMSLWCHGGFIVASAIQSGIIPYVKITSTLGGMCRVRNPWGEADVFLQNAEGEKKVMKGSLLEFNTLKGEEFELCRFS
ncbi:glycoside hydrolase [Paenibacillus sp. HJL G12]|uniref:Glycoside hydrolase n=1 Tax=Paenibacillus dendrobii TaxID=2691084 RepID=A0A7X3IHV7_9BACL|nr:glycoside hydrolase [Paenibacillus dendrobii]MWV42810.1 glycoside hydrolase [Paenibacillus dendrobii]